MHTCSISTPIKKISKVKSGVMCTVVHVHVQQLIDSHEFGGTLLHIIWWLL